MRSLIIVMGISVAGLGSRTGAAAESLQPPETKLKPATSPTATVDPPKSDERWLPLFNGRNLDGWYTFLQKHGKNSDPDHVITIEDGAIHLYKDAEEGSQVVMGYIGTEKEYANYHLRLQYRWGTKKFAPRHKLKRDAGLYYHIIARGDSMIHVLNGHIINKGRNVRCFSAEKPGEAQPITRGRIALEIEAAELYFRNVELRNLIRID
jgi:hypothetical protein